MWFSLLALFGPISVIMDFLPIFGAISRSVIGVITFLVAFVLTIMTILVSILLHSFIGLIIALVIIIGAIITFFVILENKRAAIVPAAVPVSTPPLTNHLEKFVREARARGMSNDQIYQELLRAGWSHGDIIRIIG
jgi:hypothetical protein